MWCAVTRGEGRKRRSRMKKGNVQHGLEERRGEMQIEYMDNECITHIYGIRGDKDGRKR